MIEKIKKKKYKCDWCEEEKPITEIDFLEDWFGVHVMNRCHQCKEEMEIRRKIK
jgi:hypothetical protein